MRERGDTTRILVATCDTIAVTSYYTNKATTIAVYIYIYRVVGTQMKLHLVAAAVRLLLLVAGVVGQPSLPLS